MTSTLKWENSDIFGRNKIKNWTVPVACFIKNYGTYGNYLAVSVSKTFFLLLTFECLSVSSFRGSVAEIESLRHSDSLRPDISRPSQ